MKMIKTTDGLHRFIAHLLIIKLEKLARVAL